VSAPKLTVQVLAAIKSADPAEKDAMLAQLLGIAQATDAAAEAAEAKAERRREKTRARVAALRARAAGNAPDGDVRDVTHGNASNGVQSVTSVTGGDASPAHTRARVEEPKSKSNSKSTMALPGTVPTATPTATPTAQSRGGGVRDDGGEPVAPVDPVASPPADPDRPPKARRAAGRTGAPGDSRGDSRGAEPTAAASATGPRYPHFPAEACDALLERWRAHWGVVDYGRFRRALAPLFRRPAEQGGPDYAPELLAEAIGVYRDVIEHESAFEFSQASPERFVARIAEWTRLAAMPQITADTGEMTERMLRVLGMARPARAA